MQYVPIFLYGDSMTMSNDLNVGYEDPSLISDVFNWESYFACNASLTLNQPVLDAGAANKVRTIILDEDHYPILFNLSTKDIINEHSLPLSSVVGEIILIKESDLHKYEHAYVPSFMQREVVKVATSKHLKQGKSIINAYSYVCSDPATMYGIMQELGTYNLTYLSDFKRKAQIHVL